MDEVKMAEFDIREVAAFFDRYAPEWDAGMIRNDVVIGRILDLAEIGEGTDVLDVACGTGVLIPDYLARNVLRVTAVDVSPGMAGICRQKFADELKVDVLCGDVMDLPKDPCWDAVMVYNAFPHFPDPEALVAHLSGLVRPGGTLTVAHGMSREAINRHHGGSARHISRGLPPAEQVAEIFGRYLDVKHVLSDEKMYLVTGRK